MKDVNPDRNLAITIGLRFVAPEVGGSRPPNRTIFPHFNVSFLDSGIAVTLGQMLVSIRHDRPSPLSTVGTQIPTPADSLHKTPA